MQIYFLIQKSIQVVFQCVHGFNYLCVHTCVTICVQIYVCCNSLCQRLYMCVCSCVNVHAWGARKHKFKWLCARCYLCMCIYKWSMIVRVSMWLCGYVCMCTSMLSIIHAYLWKKEDNHLCNFVWNLSCIVVKMTA